MPQRRAVGSASKIWTKTYTTTAFALLQLRGLRPTNLTKTSSTLYEPAGSSLAINRVGI